MGNKATGQTGLGQGYMSAAEDQRDYLRVPSPRLWMFLSVIVLLVAGFCAYAFAVTQENTVYTVAEVGLVEDGEGNSGLLILVEVPSQVVKAVGPGTPIKIEDEPGELDSVYTDLEGNAHGYAMLDNPTTRPDGSMIFEDGTYDAQIILDDVPLLGFLS